jgi:ubiquinone/menaquinone biosynthesis C-methylase UbiE
MSESRFDDSQAYFAAIAEAYDCLQPVVAGPAYQAGLDFVIEVIPHEPDDAFTCVELGCGTAALTEAVLERFPAAECVAIDSEPAMLDIARRKLAAHGDRAEVRMAEAATAHLPKCDLVLSSFMLHHVPPDDLPELLRRTATALSSGGCAIFLDTMQAGPRWGECIGAVSGRLHRQHVEVAIAAGRATQEEIDARWAFKRKMKEEGRDVEHRHSAEDLLAAMSAAGFEETGLVWRQVATTIVMGFLRR